MTIKLLIFIGICTLFSSCKDEVKTKNPIEKSVEVLKNDSIIHDYIKKDIVNRERFSESMESRIVQYLVDSLSDYESGQLAAKLYWAGDKFTDTLYTKIGEEVFEDFLEKNANTGIEYESYRLRVSYPFGISDEYIFTVYQKNGAYRKVEKHIKAKRYDSKPSEINLIENKETVLTEKEWKIYRAMFYDIDFWSQPVGLIDRMLCDGESLELEGLIVSENRGNYIHKMNRHCPREKTGIYYLYEELLKPNVTFLNE